MEAGHGTVYNSLHSVETTTQLLRSQQVTKVRLLNADVATLQAFSNTGIEVIVGVLNEEVKDLGESISKAFSWVERSVLAHIPGTNITAVAVGSELITSNPHLAAFLVPACWNIHAALHYFGLDAVIKVSAPQSMFLLERRFPPSSGRFNNTYSNSILRPFLKFLRTSGSSFMVNVYPVQFYDSLVLEIDMDFALLQPNRVLDNPKDGLRYAVIDSLVDALFTAMSALNYGNIQVVAIETGWVPEEYQDEVAKFYRNAAVYASNMKAHLVSTSDTSLKHGQEILTCTNRILNENDILAPSYSEHDYPFKTNGPQFNVTQSWQVTVGSIYDKTWCVAKQYATPDDLQRALDWACGFGGADCQPLQLGNPCFVPNTVYSHASYAFNSYYQIHQHASGTCDFGGTATVTYEDPSYPGCSYPFRPGQVGAPVGGASKGLYQCIRLITLLLFLMYML